MDKSANDANLVMIYERLDEKFGPDIAGSVSVVVLTSETVAKMESGTDGFMFTCAFRQQSRVWKQKNCQREYRKTFFGRAVLREYLKELGDKEKFFFET